MRLMQCFLLLLIFQAPLASASGGNCLRVMRGIGSEAMVAATGNHPKLTQYLANLVHDPLTPPAVQRVIHEAIVEKKTDIRELTEQLKKAAGKEPEVRGFHETDFDQLAMQDKVTCAQTRWTIFAPNPYLEIGSQ